MTIFSIKKDIPSNRNQRTSMEGTTKVHGKKTHIALKANKFSGGIVGGGIGDALGMAVEFMTPEQILAKFGVVRDFLPKPNKQLKAGQWTDDTLLNLDTLESIIINKAVIPSDIANRFVHSFQAQRQRGFGKSTKTAITRLTKGHNWKASGATDEFSAGNGAAMRIAPVALFNCLDLSKLKRNVEMVSQITHRHPEAIAGSQAIALFIAKAATGGLNPETIINEAIEFIGPSKMSEKLLEVEETLEGRALDFAAGLQKLGTSGYVLETVASAVYAFLSFSDDFEQMLIKVVSAGGDADTIGSIAGAISGTYNGLEKIPQRWRTTLEQSTRIENLSHKLFLAVTEQD